ncbi:MAG: hypothetical protein K6B51_05665 [Bacilli bacterium]|nr:hypothetical protein [Bacilli bacterium]
MADFFHLFDEVADNGNFSFWSWFEAHGASIAAIFSACAAIVSAIMAIVVFINQNGRVKNESRIDAYLSLTATLSDMRAYVDSIPEDFSDLPELKPFDVDKRLSMDFRRVDAYGFFFKKKKVNEAMSTKDGSDTLASRICDLSEDFKKIYKLVDKCAKSKKVSDEDRCLIKERRDRFFKDEDRINRELGKLLEKN